VLLFDATAAEVMTCSVRQFSPPRSTQKKRILKSDITFKSLEPQKAHECKTEKILLATLFWPWK